MTIETGDGVTLLFVQFISCAFHLNKNALLKATSENCTRSNVMGMHFTLQHSTERMSHLILYSEFNWSQITISLAGNPASVTIWTTLKD